MTSVVKPSDVKGHAWRREKEMKAHGRFSRDLIESDEGQDAMEQNSIRMGIGARDRGRLTDSNREHRR